MSRVRISAWLFGATVAVTLVGTAACGSVTLSGTATDQGSTTSTVLATTSATTDATSGDASRFAGSSFPAEVTGFDESTRILSFTVEKWQSGGPDGGHYIDDPATPGKHQLAVAANPSIGANVGRLCEGVIAPDNTTDQPCTEQQMVQGLSENQSALAQLKVTSSGQVQSIQELYTP